MKHFSDFVIGLADMLFIYWGWDTALNLNEETADAETIPGKAGVYLDILAARDLRARHSRDAILRRHWLDRHRPWQPEPHERRALNPRTRDLRPLHLRIDPRPLAAADGAVLGLRLDPDHDPADGPHRALDVGAQGASRRLCEGSPAFSSHPPSRPSLGVVSAGLYVVMNFISAGHVIADSVDALGVMIAFYYGLTGFSCAWYYHKQSLKNVHNFFVQLRRSPHRRCHLVADPRLVLLVLLEPRQQLHALGRVQPRDRWHLHPRRGDAAIGVILMFTMNAFRPAFFRGETLRRDSPTLVTESFLAGTEHAQ